MPAVRKFSAEDFSWRLLGRWRHGLCCRGGSVSGGVSSLRSSFTRSVDSIANGFSGFTGSFRSCIGRGPRIGSGFLSGFRSGLLLLRARSERQRNCESGENQFGVHVSYHPDV